MLEVADHQDPVSRRDAEHGQKPDQRAQRQYATAQPHREHPANQRHRQGEEEQQSQTQTPEGSLQEEEYHERYGYPVDQQLLLRGGQLVGLSQHLHVVLTRQLDSRNGILHGAHGGAEIASLHVGADVDPARLIHALYGVGGRREANVCQLLQRDLFTPGRVDRKLAQAGDAVAGLWDAPDVHVVGLATTKDVADFLAGDQRGRLPTHVARLDAVVLRRGEVHLDLRVWKVLLEVGVGVDEAGDVLHLLRDLIRLGVKHVEVGAIDAHDDGFARARKHLLDPFSQVGLHVPIEPGVAVDRLLDGDQSIVIVDCGIDADPVLAEVHAVGLVGQESLSYVRSAVAHARDLPQVLTGPNRDSKLFRSRRAGLGQPVHEEVPLLEVRKQDRPERWRHHSAGKHNDDHGNDRGSRGADDARKASAVAAL